MSPFYVTISQFDWNLLKDRLFTADGNENAAVLLCGISETPPERRLLVRRIVVVPPESYIAREPIHLEIAPTFYNDIVTQCLRDHLAPIIVHSHRFDGEALYSPSDDFGELRLLRVLQSLLSDVTPASMVMSHSSVTGRLLIHDEFRALAGLRVVGVQSSLIRFDRRERRAKLAGRFDRQVRAFGEEGQRVVSALRVAVVGAGGIGSLVAEQLVRAGIVDITVIDNDVVEESNVSRLFGATARDVGRPKVDVLARHLKRLGATTIVPINRSAIAQQVLLLLRDRDLIFSCVDNDRTRALLSRFAYQYLIPVIDHGTRLDGRDGRISAAAGRVSIVSSGLTCLRCSHHINSERIRAESMTRNEREALAREGYIMGIDEPAPAVVSINTVVAGLGVTAGINLYVGLTGGVQPMDQIYDARTGSVFPVTPTHEPGCDICDEHVGLKALGDAQVVSAYDCEPNHNQDKIALQ